MKDMFAPPPPLEFKNSVCKRKPPEIQGIAAMLKSKDGESLFEKGTPPPPEKFETPRQRHARIAAAKKEVEMSGLVFCFFSSCVRVCVWYVTRLREIRWVRRSTCLSSHLRRTTWDAASLDCRVLLRRKTTPVYIRMNTRPAHRPPSPPLARRDDT